MSYTFLVNKANKSYTIDFDSLPEVSRQFIIEYGLKQKFNDSNASVIVKDLNPGEAEQQSRDIAEDLIKSLKAGTIHIRANKAQTVEEKVLSKAIRDNFKALCKAKIEDQTDEELVAAIADVKGMEPEEVLSILKAKVPALIAKAQELAAIKAAASAESTI